MKNVERETPKTDWQKRLHEIIFEAETPAGKFFDITLIGLIIFSLLVVIVESVKEVREQYGTILLAAEWMFTFLFTIEYVLRFISVRRPLRYVFSFYGLIDLAAILPTYLSLFIPGTQYFLTVRVLRLLRIFRILKLTEYITEGRVITAALRASRRKISVFLSTVLTLVVVIGTLIYVIEGEENGFVDIPTGIYWAIVTITTVGYGDLSPRTPVGRLLAAFVMILGYAIIAVPTGIVTVELSRQSAGAGASTQVCPECHAEGHDMDAVHCKYCGSVL
jgi:Kef-type K+ transport systems, predicted NAD-binding component